MNYTHFSMHLALYMLTLMSNATYALYTMPAFPEKNLTWHALVENARAHPQTQRTSITNILATHPEFHEALFHEMLYSPTVFPHSALWILEECINNCTLRKTDNTLIPRSVKQQTAFAELIDSLEAMCKTADKQLSTGRHHHKEALMQWQPNKELAQNLSKKLEKLLLQSIDDNENAQAQEHIIWIRNADETQENDGASANGAICFNELFAQITRHKKDC